MIIRIHPCPKSNFLYNQDIGQPVMYQGPQEFGKYLKDGFDDYGKLINEPLPGLEWVPTTGCGLGLTDYVLKVQHIFS